MLAISGKGRGKITPPWASSHPAPLDQGACISKDLEEFSWTNSSARRTSGLREGAKSGSQHRSVDPYPVRPAPNGGTAAFSGFFLTWDAVPYKSVKFSLICFFRVPTTSTTLFYVWRFASLWNIGHGVSFSEVVGRLECLYNRSNHNIFHVERSFMMMATRSMRDRFSYFFLCKLIISNVRWL